MDVHFKHIIHSINVFLVGRKKKEQEIFPSYFNQSCKVYFASLSQVIADSQMYT